MNLTIYYYTGTGNSLWTARKIAEKFTIARLVPMTMDPHETDTGIVGFVFPVHMWGVPRRVSEFVNRLEMDPNVDCFAVAVNAGQVSRTLIQFRKLLAGRGVRMRLGCSVVLPSNYIPWGGPGTDEEIAARIRAAEQKINRIAEDIKEKKTARIEKGPLWQRIVFTGLYKLAFNQVPKMDRRFFVEETCTACGICERVCMAGNIRLVDGKPVWGGHCEQCLACIQWCPEQAIQYGPKTKDYKRYHHPEITLKMISRPTE